MANPLISIIIPTHNNTATLALTLLDIRHHLHESPEKYEVIVVDDRSTDATFEVARRLMPITKSLRVEKYFGLSGIGATVQYGMKLARGTWRMVLSPSGAVSIDELQKLLPYLERGEADIVIGSGFSKNALSLLQTFGYLFRLWYTFARGIILSTGVWDAEDYCFVVTEHVAQTVYPLLKISGVGGMLELIAVARHAQYKIRECSVLRATSSVSAVRYWYYVEMLQDALRVWWAIIAGNYKLSIKK